PPGVAAPPGLDSLPGLGAAAEGFDAPDACAVGAASAFGAGASGWDAGLAGPGFGPGTGAPVLAAEEADAAAALLSSALPAGLADGSAEMAARSLRATGGSMVDEGLFTNSPSSLSFARANLLSTPSSAAISCTRGLAATILLSGSAYPGSADHYRRTGLISSRSLCFHSRSAFVSLAVLLDGLCVHDVGHTQCSCECAPPQGGIQA